MTQKHSNSRKSARRQASLWLLICVCAGQALLLAGCHRGFYRRQADAEVNRLVAQKAASSRWDSVNGDITIDPASRMFDPFSADHPPLPPDDPTSHKLMHNVDNKKGYPHWHANGDATIVEGPNWRSYLPRNEKGEVVLSLSTAYQLALLNSTDLQQQRETLYLSALDVSLQRFGFDSQLFAGFNSFLEHAGRFQSPSGQSSTTLTSSFGPNSEGLSASRMGITGASFVVGLANTILWEFSGNNTQSATSLIDFSIVQPLLRGAGRERILESLTQSERTLLANVRQLERFRRGFYLQVATGRNPGAGPTLNSNAFLNSPGLAGSNVGGYFGLLLQQQTIRNLEFNVAQFETLLKQFRELFDEDRIDSLQVAQFETNVYQQQQSLLNAKINYQNTLDTFKVLLGLPPDLDVIIEDPFLDQFKLIEDNFSQRLVDIKELREETSLPVVRLSTALRKDLDAGEENDAELKKKTQALRPFLDKAGQLIDKIIEQDLKLVREDLQQLADVREKRITYLEQVSDDIEGGRLLAQVEPKVFTAESIPTQKSLSRQLDDTSNERSLLRQLNGLKKEVKDLTKQISSLEKLEGDKEQSLARRIENTYAKRIPDLLTDIDGVILEMALIQAEARTNTIEISDVQIDAMKALETARCLRRDWMNARAALVDNWRQIEFFADQLESELDLVVSGEVGNVGDNPFRVRFENGNVRFGFQFDSPLVRQSERNSYRSALISYQQARRDYYQFEDSIKQSLRQTIRNIQQNKLLFELNRQNIQVNINGVQLARARLVAPPRVGDTGGLSDVTSQNLTFALNSLTGVQNSYVANWLEYEVLRRTLDFDMGTMQLDELYEWRDPGFIDDGIGVAAASRDGVAENDANCCGMFTQNIPEGSLEPMTTIGEDEVIDSPPLESESEESDRYQDVTEAEPEMVELPEPPGEDKVQPLDLEPIEMPDVPSATDPPSPPAEDLLLRKDGRTIQRQSAEAPLIRIDDRFSSNPSASATARRSDAGPPGFVRTRLNANPASWKRTNSDSNLKALPNSKKLMEAFSPDSKLPDFQSLPVPKWNLPSLPPPTGSK